MIPAIVFSLLLSPVRAAEPADPFLWLEEVQSPKAMEWVKSHNDKSVALLAGDRRYKRIESDARAIITAKDRLPTPWRRNGWVYNFWQDAEHQHGLWRRTRPEEYEKKDPEWEVILDVDKLNKDEHQDWVYEGSNCLPPAYEDCLVSLSHGGKDATVAREFDVAKAAWVEGGFALPESKQSVDWIDRDRLLVATDYGPGSMTTSSYPRIVKVWRRGTPLSSAKTLLEAETSAVGAQGSTEFRPEGAVTILQKDVTFWTSKRWVLQPDESLKAIPFPDDVSYQGAYKGRFFALLRSDWKTGDKVLPAGALVALPMDALWDARPETSAELVYAPDARSSVVGIATTKDRLFIDALVNVQGRVFEAQRTPAGWSMSQLQFPALGMASVVSSDDFSNAAYLRYESFLIPTTLYAYDGSGEPRPVKSLPARFEAKGLTVDQLEATSADGTKVPYFLVHRQDLKMDGSHPTLLYGYGGFEIPMNPSYLNETGKLWLEKGEVYALANIRGGGEFGPKWHKAALKENRQRAYDDFAAVAKDLIARKVTSPRRLGIMGGSNGGLLMGATFTQHPELFRAVVCAVPLLDMLRYTKIAAGASWIDEYGDPADAKMAETIAKYSPYQNAKAGVKYPEVFFVTSTKDDRVGPVHARKMAAKLESLGDKTLYWENIEGGHGAAADLDERVKMKSLEFAYLLRQLAD